MNIEFTILMPCLNEEKTISFCVDEATLFINESDISAEILIADSGSTDRLYKNFNTHHKAIQ